MQIKIIIKDKNLKRNIDLDFFFISITKYIIYKNEGMSINLIKSIVVDIYSIKFTNAESFVLPITGGISSIIFTIIGIIFMAIGIFLIIFKNKMKIA